MLTLLTQKKTTTLGLDIGSRATKVIKFSHTSNSLEFCGQLATPPEDSLIQDLHQYFEKNNLLGLKTAAIIDDTSFRTRAIDLPKMPQSDLKEAVRWKMRDVVDGSIEDYVVRSSPLDKPSGEETKGVRLLGYAITKKSVDHLLKLLQKAGLNPVNIEPSAVSLASAVELFHPSEDKWIAGIDLGASKTQMIVTGHRKLYFTRYLSGIVPPTEDAEDELDGFKQKLAAETQNALDAFSVNFQEGQIDRLILSGSVSEMPELTDYLSKNIGIKTEVIDPFKGLQIGEAIQEVIKEKPYLYSQAVSLARL